MCEVIESTKSESLYQKRENARHTLVKSLRCGGLWDLAAKVEECQQRFFGFIAGACGCAKAVPVSCCVRGCPHCEKRRGSRLYRIVMRLFSEMENPRIITLTIKNLETFDGGDIDRLRERFTRLRHMKRFLRYVEGGFYTVEITNKGKGWHPHIHFLCEGAYYPQDELSEDWQAVGGDPVVWIQKADEKGVMELCWYLVKGSQFFESPERTMQLFEAIKGKRMAGAFGSCFKRYNDVRSEEREEEKEPATCSHGNEFEWAGHLAVNDVYLHAESREWRIYKASLTLLQLEFFERIKRAA